MNIQLNQAKYDKARTIAQVLDKRVRFLRCQGAASVKDVMGATTLSTILDELQVEFEKELEDMAHKYEGVGAGDLNDEDHIQLGF